MTLAGTTIDAAEIAAALDWSKPYFLRKMRDLIENQGMPHRIPGSARNGGRWHRASIEAWLASYDTRKRQASEDEEYQVSVSSDRARLYLAYVNPAPAQAAGGPRLVVDNSGARA